MTVRGGTGGGRDPREVAKVAYAIYQAITEPAAGSEDAGGVILDAGVVLDALLANAGRIIASCPEEGVRRLYLERCQLMLPAFVAESVRRGDHPEGSIAESLQ